MGATNRGTGAIAGTGAITGARSGRTAVTGGAAAARTAAVGRRRPRLAGYALAAVVLGAEQMARVGIMTVIAVITVIVVTVVPAVIVPGIPCPAAVIPGAVPAPVTVTVPVGAVPGPIVPRAVVPAVEIPAVIVPGSGIVPEVPGAVIPRIIPRPGGLCSVHDCDGGIAEAHGLAGRHYERVAFTDNIDGGFFALGQKDIHFFVVHVAGLDLGDDGRTVVDAVIVNLGLKAGHGRAGHGG